MWQWQVLVQLWELAGVEKDVFSISDTDGSEENNLSTPNRSGTYEPRPLCYKYRPNLIPWFSPLGTRLILPRGKIYVATSCSKGGHRYLMDKSLSSGGRNNIGLPHKLTLIH